MVVSLLLRFGVVGFLYPEHLNPDRGFWRFAGEAGKIAQSLVEGRGFGSPFFADTGPTALMPPVYPYLIAGVFEFFGTYTKASALVMLSLDSLFSALTCLPIYFIARKCFGDRVAVIAAWTWAFFPYAIYFSADFIWPTVLTTLLLSLLFLMVLHLASSSRLSLWLGFGLLSGLATLTEPIVLSVLPLLGMGLLSTVSEEPTMVSFRSRGGIGIGRFHLSLVHPQLSYIPQAHSFPRQFRARVVRRKQWRELALGLSRDSSFSQQNRVAGVRFARRAWLHGAQAA